MTKYELLQSRPNVMLASDSTAIEDLSKGTILPPKGPDSLSTLPQ